METETKNYEATQQQMAEEPCCAAGATVHKIIEQGAEVLEQAEQLVSNAYEKTSRKVSETYDKARNYRNENPGTIILIALGIGVGIGILLGTKTRR